MTRHAGCNMLCASSIARRRRSSNNCWLGYNPALRAGIETLRVEGYETGLQVLNRGLGQGHWDWVDTNQLLVAALLRVSTKSSFTGAFRCRNMRHATIRDVRPDGEISCDGYAKTGSP